MEEFLDTSESFSMSQGSALQPWYSHASAASGSQTRGIGKGAAISWEATFHKPPGVLMTPKIPPSFEPGIGQNWFQYEEHILD